MATHLFISYAPEDRRCFDDLERHLRPLHAQGRITYWHMGMVPAGGDWRTWRREHLDQAQVILCLISADYLAQEQELAEIYQRQRAGAQVIPVLVKAALLMDTPFEALQLLPRGGKPISQWKNQDKVILAVVKGVLEAIKVATPATPPMPTGQEATASRPARVPTTASLLQLLEHALREESDVEAFCNEYFPAVKKRFLEGMDRTQKLNTLLVHADGFDILESLCDCAPGRSATERWVERIEWEDSLCDVSVVPVTKRRRRPKRRLYDFVCGALFADWARRLWNDLTPTGRAVVLIVASMLLSGLGVTQFLQRYSYTSARGRNGGMRPKQPPGPLLIPPQMMAWPDGGAVWGPTSSERTPATTSQ